MSWLWAETIIQIAGVLLLSPLVLGIMNRLKAIVESRHGPSILQPYYDLAKYLRKEMLIPENSTAIFYAAPFFVFGTYILISFVIPVILPFPVYFTPLLTFSEVVCYLRSPHSCSYLERSTQETTSRQWAPADRRHSPRLRSPLL